MTSIASKNLYELLGNDPELDPERRTPEQPTKAIDKPVARSGKRDGGPAPPVTTSPPRGGGRGRGGRGGATGNERAFREGVGGRESNRSTNPDDLPTQSDRPPRGEGYRGRGRGEGYRGRGRGGRGGSRNDRHSASAVGDHQKQAAHGWGGPTGNDELADEKAGEAIAKTEEKEGWDSNPAAPVDAEGDSYAPDGDAGNGEPAEPEGPKSKSYEEYLAELAEKKLTLGGGLSTRKANEGASKKFPEGKAFARNDEEENFFVGSGGKAGRVREKKEKQTVDMTGIDPRSYLAEERSAGDRGDRGGRGGRGGRGRGEGRGRGRGGDRGDFRGDRAERGDRADRGGRGDRADRGERNEYRGRGGRGSNAPRLDDNSAFPTLGS